MLNLRSKAIFAVASIAGMVALGAFSPSTISSMEKEYVTESSLREKLYSSLAEMGFEDSLQSKLVDQHHVLQQGLDQELRPLFVPAQGMIEQTIVQLLARGDLESAFGMIHTPAPATPLCLAESEEGLNGKALSDLANFTDEERLQTLRKRPTILRAFLKAGGHLTVAFPKDGRKLRKQDELKIFDGLLREFQGRLEQKVLPMDQLADDLIGATYLFRSSTGEEWVFSIRATQAIDARDEMIWELWLGPKEDPLIAERYERIFNILQ